ncbi:DUF1761 domain-containing protein [Alphaproteobacteria bacterium KMM 3653]|uniref:DUF1761 domain-containing protein n=1 Tax=Harenicola maris TaxID=2841044 RepID=A0AAP2G7Y3_9RHOB|nr:DUF1761 domain-containing protein [Harenicola maris]
MELINIIAAAAAAWAFGAVWYMALAKPWQAAANLSEEQVKQLNPMVYAISFAMAVVTAGMMRHIFASSGVTTIGAGAISGFGLGAFITLPWLVTHYLFAMKPKALIVIDGGYGVIGSTLMGIVLMAF